MKIESRSRKIVETILTWAKSCEIAIPETQRPFIWEATPLELHEG